MIKKTIKILFFFALARVFSESLELELLIYRLSTGNLAGASAILPSVPAADLQSQGTRILASVLSGSDKIGWIAEKGLKFSAAQMTQLLYAACEDDNQKMIDYCLAAGADAKAADGNGRTPLMRAAASGSVQGIQKLIKAGADAQAADRFGFTAFSYGLFSPGSAKLKTVLGGAVSDADFFALMLSGTDPGNKFAANAVANDLKDWYGRTVAYWLIGDGGGIPDAVKLFDSAFPAPSPDPNGLGEIYAALKAKEKRQAAAAALFAAEDSFGFSPVFLCAISGDETLFSQMILRLGNPDLKDAGGKSLLETVIENGRDDLVGVLLEAGADPDIPDSTGTTTLRAMLEKKGYENIPPKKD
jgi:ankyrin repeat protein